MRFTGQVSSDGSRIKFDAEALFAAHRLKLKGKRVEVSLERENVKRNDAQNRRFFARIVPVCREILNQELAKRGCLLQWSKDQVHEKLEEWVLGFEDTPLGPVRRRCSALETAAFSKFCDECEETFRERYGAVFPSEEMVAEAGL